MALQPLDRVAKVVGHAIVAVALCLIDAGQERVGGLLGPPELGQSITETAPGVAFVLAQGQVGAQLGDGIVEPVCAKQLVGVGEANPSDPWGLADHAREVLESIGVVHRARMASLARSRRAPGPWVDGSSPSVQCFRGLSPGRDRPPGETALEGSIIKAGYFPTNRSQMGSLILIVLAAVAAVIIGLWLIGTLLSVASGLLWPLTLIAIGVGLGVWFMRSRGRSNKPSRV